MAHRPRLARGIYHAIRMLRPTAKAIPVQIEPTFVGWQPAQAGFVGTGTASAVYSQIWGAGIISP
ncbi:MAG: hypothetical protein NZ874_02290 [Fimbriimonadales bacterium]|nr:hypothetical protein [Fimbriimonadales bacterium]